MPTIAICDDDKIDIKKIIALVQEWSVGKNKTDIQIKHFSSPYMLLDEVENGANFDLFLLDILMPEMTGITLGERLHQLLVNPVLIFLTSSEDYYPDAFRLYAFQYLCKPVRKNDLFVALEKALAHCQERENDVFLLKTQSGLTRLPLHSIVYVELLAHICHFYLKDKQQFESLYLRAGVDSFLEPLLRHKQFVKTHTSFVVNLNFIDTLSVSGAFLTLGKTVPIARSYAKKVQQRYVEYRLKGDNPL